MKIIESPNRQKLNESYMRWSRSEALKSSQRRMQRDCASASYAWMLLPLSLLLTACAAPLPVTCRQPEMIPMPALTEPLPPVSYSLSAVRAIQRWQAAVIDMSVTSKP